MKRRLISCPDVVDVVVHWLYRGGRDRGLDQALRRAGGPTDLRGCPGPHLRIIIIMVLMEKNDINWCDYSFILNYLKPSCSNLNDFRPMELFLNGYSSVPFGSNLTIVRPHGGLLRKAFEASRGPSSTVRYQR